MTTNPGVALIKGQSLKLTPFQTKVLLALCQVPEGKVTTYKYLSDSIHCKSSQAVGQALKRNPYAPIVPCHRVIQSHLSLGGFGGTRVGSKIDKKIELLESEGVRIGQDGKVDSKFIYKFS
jgi:methylated-DNA-[protein]-cysteine S-methyltransferase